MAELGPFGRIIKQHTPSRATITVDATMPTMTVQWGEAFVDILYNRRRDVYHIDLAGILLDVDRADLFLDAVVTQLAQMRAAGRERGLVPPEAGI